MFDIDAARQQISWAALDSRPSLNALASVLLLLKDNPYITVRIYTVGRHAFWGASIHLYSDGITVISPQLFASLLSAIFAALQDLASRRGETPEMVELQALLTHIWLTVKEKGLL